MRVGIDLSLACKNNPRGIGVFEKNIGLPNETFLKLNQVYVFGIGIKPNWIPFEVKYINLYINNPIVREQLLIPLFVFRYRIKNLHLFGNVIPLVLAKSFCKLFLTIHDVSFKYSSDYMISHKKQNTIKRRVGLAYQSIFLNPSCKYSNKIFTVSNWAMTEIIKHTSTIDDEKISIIPNVCNSRFITTPKPKWIEKNNSILLVTGAHPQKNIIFFLDCFMELCKSNKIDFIVDIVGVVKHDLEKRYSEFRKFKFHGMASQNKLIEFYDNAKLLVMPSMFESFSIPLIEAKYRGLWILSSNGGATREVISNYASFFNPKNDEEFAEQLLNLLSNKVQSPPKHFNESFDQVNINELYWQIFYD
jgi:glycosyltransferase involved in cell wall biosynthesis